MPWCSLDLAMQKQDLKPNRVKRGLSAGHVYRSNHADILRLKECARIRLGTTFQSAKRGVPPITFDLMKPQG